MRLEALYVNMWQIKDWGSIFEDRRTREVKELFYVRWPCNRDAEAVRYLMRTGPGREAFGIFGRLVQIAARCPDRGVLSDSKGPWDEKRVAAFLGCPDRAVAAAFQVLSSSAVGWLVRADQAPTARRPSADEDAGSCRPNDDEAPTGAPTLQTAEQSRAEKDKSKTKQNPPKPPKGGGEIPLGCGVFWERWPSGSRKIDRPKVVNYWRDKGLEAFAEEILAGLDRWKNSAEWAKEGGQFIPAPMPWLRGERWNAEPEPAGRTGSAWDKIDLAALENGR